jgi:hypothetical protein
MGKKSANNFKLTFCPAIAIEQNHFFFVLCKNEN